MKTAGNKKKGEYLESWTNLPTFSSVNFKPKSKYV